MSKTTVLLVALMSFIILFSVSCVKDDEDENQNTMNTPTGLNDLNPTIAEWAIMFASGNIKTTYTIGIYWIGGANPPQIDDSATLLVNGTDTEIQNIAPGIWFGAYDISQGANATIKFIYNDVTKIDTSLKMVNPISGTSFPNNYNPAQTAAISWTLSANNEHQIVEISAYKEDTTKEDWSDAYVKEISSELRSYTFPANPIPNVPEGATFTIGISEVNYKILNKVALMSLNGAFSDQYAKNNNPESSKTNILRMLSLLTK